MKEKQLIASFEQLLAGLQHIITARLQHLTAQNEEPAGIPSFTVPRPSPIGDFITQHQLNTNEILVLWMALVPHIQPGFYDTCMQAYLATPGDYPQLGGTRGKSTRSFLPTGETVLFMLAGTHLEKRMAIQAMLAPHHKFALHNILWLEEVPIGEPVMSGRLILSSELVEYFLTGSNSIPALSMNFPAQYITTDMEWSDLVLPQQILTQVDELSNWVAHHHALTTEWEMRKKFKPGYRALFYGPPGTGKTLTATLLGKHTQRAVFRIDLSMVISKFVGETEKNLSLLFNKAESKDWILFFDEADALFSKRTNVRDAHDKYANQEASYLLQRIEQFDGLVILATNYRNNIDDAFIRRFHTVIHFPAPVHQERLQIWEKGFPKKAKLAKDIDLNSIAKKYELTGAGIMSVIHYCCLQAITQGSNVITQEILTEGVKKEYGKDGKIW